MIYGIRKKMETKSIYSFIKFWDPNNKFGYKF